MQIFKDSTPVYYHGGFPGLKCGDLLKSDYSPYRKDRIYFTTTYAVAKGYALGYPGGGDVYQVQPEGDLIRDEQSLFYPDKGYCSKVRVLSVVKHFSQFEQEIEKQLCGEKKKNEEYNVFGGILLLGLLIPNNRKR